MQDATTISSVVEIPEELHDAVSQYLDSRPGWDMDRVAIAAFSLFLLQNGGAEAEYSPARLYLDALFDAGEAA